MKSNRNYRIKWSVFLIIKMILGLEYPVINNQ